MPPFRHTKSEAASAALTFCCLFHSMFGFPRKGPLIKMIGLMITFSSAPRGSRGQAKSTLSKMFLGTFARAVVRLCVKSAKMIVVGPAESGLVPDKRSPRVVSLVKSNIKFHRRKKGGLVPSPPLW